MQRFCLIVLTLLFPGGLLAGTLAQFRTPLGTIDVELFDTEKPVTVKNFIRYVQSGAYTNMFFHRCIPGFVVQGGGFSALNRFDTNAFTSFFYVTNFGTITNEFDVGPKRSNTYGTIAMAKLGGDPNSASSQWFFNLADNSGNLDNQNGGFTVFGRVIGGTNVLNQFNTFSFETNIVDLRWWYGPSNLVAALYSDLPVRYTGTAYPRYVDLFYVDISLLNVQVKTSGNGSREISWNSVSNRLNRVEFTTNLPPAWHTLQTTNGNGSLVKVTDTATNRVQRFYRVRLD